MGNVCFWTCVRRRLAIHDIGNGIWPHSVSRLGWLWFLVDGATRRKPRAWYAWSKNKTASRAGEAGGCDFRTQQGSAARSVSSWILVAGKGQKTSEQVLLNVFSTKWRTEEDSNPRPLDS